MNCIGFGNTFLKETTKLHAHELNDSTVRASFQTEAF